MQGVHLADLAIWFPAFLLSLTAHEAAHAFTARALGDPTAARQASLNPIPHIQQEPVGTILVPIISFFVAGWTLGWASTPYDPFWAKRNPRKAGLMAAAGPGANFLLAGLALAGIWALQGAGYAVLDLNQSSLTELLVARGGAPTYLTRFLLVLYLLNLILGFFNLIPVPPLDGAGMVEGFLPRSAPARLLESFGEGGYAMLGILVAWVIFDYVIGPATIRLAFLGLGL